MKTKNLKKNTNNEEENEDNSSEPNISASIFGIIEDRNNKGKFVLPKETYNLRRYFMGIYN